MHDGPTTSESGTPRQVGPYVIEREIGSGGMGTVYLARRENAEERVALKVLPASLARESGFVARFQREVSALEKLKNPHVVELYDSGVDDNDLYYYAMEYIAGTTLADHVRNTGRIEWREAIDIAVQVCSALKAAHDAGVIHRDLKPSNLLITDGGQVKLTDFGVAQVFAGTRLTKTGGVIGTVEYMSPEQAKGGRVTKQSDLYSLGAVLYAMLTGRPPFTGKTTLEVIQKHQHGRFDTPRRYVPDLPIWLDDLVCQLLEKEPEKRPPDAFVLSRRLQEIVRKVELSLQQKTVSVEDRDSSAPGPTVTADAGDAPRRYEPGVGTLMRDAVREELLSQSQPGLFGRIFNNTWVLVGMLVLLIAGGVWWWNSRQLTPEERFNAGVALMQQDEGEAWLRARDEYFQPLLEADPDRWKPKIRPFLKRIERYELKRRFTSNRRLGNRQSPESEAERFLLLAVQFRQMGQLDRAEETLIALKTLTEGDPEQQPLHKLTDELLADIRAERNRQRRTSTLLSDAMSRAEKQLQAGNVAEARNIWQAVLLLYENDPQAKAVVQRVRRLLNEHPATDQPPSKDE